METAGMRIQPTLRQEWLKTRNIQKQTARLDRTPALDFAQEMTEEGLESSLVHSCGDWMPETCQNGTKHINLQPTFLPAQTLRRTQGSCMEGWGLDKPSQLNLIKAIAQNQPNQSKRKGNGQPFTLTAYQRKGVTLPGNKTKTSVMLQSLLFFLIPTGNIYITVKIDHLAKELVTPNSTPPLWACGMGSNCPWSCPHKLWALLILPACTLELQYCPSLSIYMLRTPCDQLVICFFVSSHLPHNIQVSFGWKYGSPFALSLNESLNPDTCSRTL